jgi:hypothetical protein
MSTEVRTIDRMTANMSEEGRPPRVGVPIYQQMIGVPVGRLEDLSTSRNRAWVEAERLKREVARLTAELEKAKAAIIRLQRIAWPPDGVEPLGEPDALIDTDGVRWDRVGPAELEKAKAAIIRLQKIAYPDGAEPRGEPDALIDRGGVRWTRVGPDEYRDSRDLHLRVSREKLERFGGPLSEVWE